MNKWKDGIAIKRDREGWERNRLGVFILSLSYREVSLPHASNDACNNYYV
jgi:hypothetical protein